jgi:hypothetical protein
MGTLDLSTITADLGSWLPSGSSLAQNVALGAATSVVLAGLKSQAGLDALDPLHLIHKDASNNTTATAVVGKSITSAAFNALPADARAQVLAAGYVIV